MIVLQAARNLMRSGGDHQLRLLAARIFMHATSQSLHTPETVTEAIIMPTLQRGHQAAHAIWPPIHPIPASQKQQWPVGYVNGHSWPSIEWIRSAMSVDSKKGGQPGPPRVPSVRWPIEKNGQDSFCAPSRVFIPMYVILRRLRGNPLSFELYRRPASSRGRRTWPSS
jgi:hypothetical protein